MSSDKVSLNAKQQELYDTVLYRKENVFFTGCGGTGKSFITQKVVDSLHTIYGATGSIAVTASTGMAAYNIKGMTIHSFACIGLGTESAEILAARVSKSSRGIDNWQSVKVLVIDEISMVSGELFDKVEHVARVARKNNKPFGGVQLVLVGDLLQLPPVSTIDRAKRVFQAKTWSSCIKKYIRLDQVYRQSDIEFVKTLCCIRVGAITEDVLKFMEGLSSRKEYEKELEPVNLYSTKVNADTFNNDKLSELDGNVKVYRAKDKVYQGGSKILEQCPAPAVLQLKIGAQVMLVKNINRELVNGTLGTVTGFTKVVSQGYYNNHNCTNSIPIVRFTMANNRMYTRAIEEQSWETILPNGVVQSSRVQIPLILSWAITIHKSQGQNIQRLRVNLENVFESGQIYTALSRAVDPNTLEVVNFNPSKIKVDQDSLNFCFENDLV